VHVGHVERRKNLALLLHAMASDATLPRLVLAGAPKGREDVRLRDLAARLGVSSRIEFVGLLDDAGLARLYAGAACAVFPSWREGFGIPALEARRAGVPVAVSSSAALLEVAGRDAPSFAPDDAQACAAAIHAALATPPAELERAAEQARRYRWDDSARRLVEAWTDAARA
jgi:glycosyltransferase involved in cell wall biosynthesis